MVDGLTWLGGDMAYGVPPALVAIGAILVLRPVLPTVRPFRSGGLCLAAAALLWLGADDGGEMGEVGGESLARPVGGFGVEVPGIFFFLAGLLVLPRAQIPPV